MAERDLTAEFIEAYQRLDKEGQHTFAVLVELLATDPEAAKMGPVKLHEWLTRKPGEADAA